MLTVRDISLLDALTFRVRLLAWQHVLTWWPQKQVSERAAHRRIAALIRVGLVRRLRIQARPVLDLGGPMACWRPGDPAADFHALSKRLAARWSEPPVQTTVLVGTPKAAHLLGGIASGKIAVPYQASHDLGLAAVFLAKRRLDPAAAAGWLSEDMVPKPGRGQKRPDAVVYATAGQAVLAVEFGAGYPAARLEAFHCDCERKALAYEVW